MRVDRNKTYFGKIIKTDQDFADIPASDRVSFIWELTAELWSLKKSPYVKRRLQRNITKFIKK